MLAKLRGIAISVMGHIGYLLRWGLGIHESRSTPNRLFGHSASETTALKVGRPSFAKANDLQSQDGS